MKIAILAFLCFVLAPITSAADRKPLRLGELFWLLDRACSIGDEMSVEILLRAGADPSGPRGYADFHKHVDHVGIEPTWHLVMASYCGFPKVTRLLLRAGADPNLACGEGVTALTIAAEKGHTEIVRLLLAAGADKNYKGISGTSAEVADNHGHSDIAKLIRAAK